MSYLNKFLVRPDHKLRLKDYDLALPSSAGTKEGALHRLAKLQKKMDQLQAELYAEQKQSLLICLQAPDAGGKDGVVRHVLGAMNPQSCRVYSFKEPSAEELAHDFMWRIEQRTPAKGEVVVFNRSHYEDVLIVRVHNLVPEKIWSKRYDQINAFEERLISNHTHILKFFLHISKEEQLRRFKQRIDDPARQWKISEADYSERKYWEDYMTAYEEAISRCSTKHAPWFIIPSDHKWFRNLAISEIIVETMKKCRFQLPQPKVDLAVVRKEYHAAEEEKKKSKS